jgi:hypothetical protein
MAAFGILVQCPRLIHGGQPLAQRLAKSLELREFCAGAPPVVHRQIDDPEQHLALSLQVLHRGQRREPTTLQDLCRGLLIHIVTRCGHHLRLHGDIHRLVLPKNVVFEPFYLRQDARL